MTIVYSPGNVCLTLVMTATESADRVTLSVSESESGIAYCARGLPAGSATHVVLSAPLGRRVLVDAVSGGSIPYLSERDVLRPRQPMSGWTTSHPGDPMADVTTGMAYFGGPGSAVLVENFRSAGPPGRLAIVQVAAGGWHPPPGTPVRAVTVRGHPGRAEITLPGRASTASLDQGPGRPRNLGHKVQCTRIHLPVLAGTPS